MSSTHFYATAIYVLTEDARDYDHDGKPYINLDYPKGSIIAVADDGAVLSPRRTALNAAIGQGADHPDAWPALENGKIELWRDYWEVLCGTDVRFPFPTRGLANIAPYIRAVIVAPRKLVVGQAI